MAQVSEIAPGSSVDFNIEANEGQRVRVWRVVLNSPGAMGDGIAAVGVKVGDTHPVDVTLKCKSINERGDGDSRVVRMVTATYSIPEQADSPGSSPQDPPELRAATWSVSTSLMEVPVRRWYPFAGDEEEAVNPAKDIYDDITKLIPVTVVSVEQFELATGTSRFNVVGNVNKTAFYFCDWLILVHYAMFRAYSVKPSVVRYGNTTWRGYTAAFEFMIRHRTPGWEIEVPQRGLNIFNQNLNGANVDNNALCLQHENGRVKQPLALQAVPGNPPKCRAMVTLSYPDGGTFQRPASLPVPLNDDGTPRSPAANPPVIVKSYRVQDAVEFGKNFVKIGVRGDSWV